MLYASCYGEFNDQTVGEAALKLLAHNGVECRVEHPQCCGMPKFENGDLGAVASSAEAVAAFFAPLIEEGFDVVPLTTSCALMLKFEWPLLLPDNAAVKKLSQATFDLSEYVVDLSEAAWAGSDRGHAIGHCGPFRLSCPRPEYGAQGR